MYITYGREVYKKLPIPYIVYAFGRFMYARRRPCMLIYLILCSKHTHMKIPTMRTSMQFLLALALSGIITSSCTPTRHRAAQQLIDDNVTLAATQLDMLDRESHAADGTLRIPSTFRDDAVQFVPVDDWVSGFFAGSLWYLHHLTGNPEWAARARQHTLLLDSVQYLRWHHDVGFMINASYGNALRYGPEAGDTDVIITAARSLATRFRPDAGIIQSWNVDNGWQSQRGWLCPVIIDNMMNLELLFKASELSGDSELREIAVSHADRTLSEHFRPDGSCYHVVDYDPETGAVRRRCTAQGYSDDSAWSRGQAWAIYGYTLCYRYTGDERYLEQALKTWRFMADHPRRAADGVPYWDMDDPAIPDTYRDVSSAAIIASALYELSTYTDDASLVASADELIESLSTDAYRAQAGQNGGFLLMHSVGSIPHGSNIDVPLNYADYYLLEALSRKCNLENGAPVLL